MEYDLSICAIVLDETKWLKEWVAYHKVVKVSHIYLFDNGSKEPVKTTLEKEINSGFVEVIDWPGASMQMPAYSHAITHFQKDNRYLAFIDADEFLVPMVGDSLLPILAPYSKYGGLSISWRIFGSSGHLTHPTGKLVIETYNMALPLDHWENTHCKALIVCDNPSRVISAGSDPHHCRFRHPWYSVNEAFRKTPGAFSPHHSSKIRLNHYCLKSKEDFSKKINYPRADAAHLAGKSWDDFNKFDSAATEIDTCIERFIPLVKEELCSQ